IYRRVAADSYPENISVFDSLPPAARGAFEKAPLDPAKLLEVFGGQGTFFQKGSLPPGAWERIGFGLDPEKRYDYLALGGTHSYTKIDDRTYYCGTPEPLGFDEAGFPLEVTIEKPGAVPKVEKITGVQQYLWTYQKIETSDENFPKLKELLRPAGEKEIRKLEITGFLSLENYKTCKELLQTQQNRYYEITSHIAIAPGPVDLPGDDGCIKAIARRLMDMKRDPAPLGEEILNDVAPMGQPAVETLARSISKDEIIDNALLKIYSCGDQGTFLKKGPLDPPKTFD
ncbi:MAG TPA: hypothetical protein VK186_28115, partial [Candidatus Deferrimicrobium sp.]|nr:hypothetical protein [Candidatus Deferrimicrobium sp.]